MKSRNHPLDLTALTEHYGDSLLPYLPVDYDGTRKKSSKKAALPIIIKGKMKYVKVRPLLNNRTLWDRQTVFPDSTLRGPRREIRYACEIQRD